MENKIRLKTNSIKYVSQSCTPVVWFFQMCYIKMEKQDFLQSLFSFALVQNFFENCQTLLLSAYYAL